MGRHVTRSLLMAEREEGWQLLEKTLLAAQRQEGLRQSILESVDEAHPTPFRRILKIIQDHELARFSSVTRAVNVWLGLMWDSASVKLINGTIEQTLEFLDKPAARDKALKGTDAEAIHRALWCIAFDDAPASVAPAAKLIQHKSDEVRFVATWFLSLLGLEAGNAARLPAMDDANLQVAMCAFSPASGLRVSEDYESVLETEDEEDRQAEGEFDALERLYQRLPEKPVALKAIVWPWTARKADRGEVSAAMVNALGNRPPTRLIPYLKGLESWTQRSVIELLAKQNKWDKLTRDSLFELAGSSSSDVREAAFQALAKQDLKPGEPQVLEGYLNRKASDLRRAAVSMLLNQADAEALASAGRLVSSKDGQQRLAGLEMLRLMAEKNRERSACRQMGQEYAARQKKLGKEEQTQLTAIAESDREVISLDNALGLMNPAGRSPVIAPEKRQVQPLTPAALLCLQSLDELVHKHRQDTIRYKEYGVWKEDPLGSVHAYDFSSAVRNHGRADKSKRNLPLADVWKNWHASLPATHRDDDGLALLRGALAAGQCDRYRFEDIQEWADSPSKMTLLAALIGTASPPRLKYPGIVEQILMWLASLHPPQGAVEFTLDLVEQTGALVPEDLMRQLAEPRGESSGRRRYRDDDEVPDWREIELFQWWPSQVGWVAGLAGQEMTSAQFQRHWALLHWRDEPFPGARRARPRIAELLRARKLGVATSEDLVDQLLGPDHYSEYGDAFRDLSNLTSRTPDEEDRKLLELPELVELLDRIRARILEIELVRGEAPTAATNAALSIQSYYGVENLFRILAAIDQAKLKKETGWRFDKTGRGATLTHLLRVTYPREGDTPADFIARAKAAIKAGSCSEQRLLEIAFLAPQWTKFIEAYLGWEGFSEGLYWFLAHMNTGWNSDAEAAAAGAEGHVDDEGVDEDDDDDDDDVGGDAAGGAKAEKPYKPQKLTAWQRLMLERTSLSEAEREQGAVDVAWFRRTWEQLGDKRWPQMAEAARYAANPAQAKKAQFLADVLLGRTTRQELIDNIRKRQLKEHVRLLGLLPLAAGAKRDKDILERYEVLQEYRRYARKLSGLTKPAAMQACDVGFDNLARLAGYVDPLRLEWAMEAESVKDLGKGPISLTKEGITVTLSLDEQARPQMDVRRGDKPLKSIPPAIKKKHAAIAELAERGTELRRKASRMRQSLEGAMCRGDVFTAAELLQLCDHAILSPLLSRLVLIGEGIAGYPDKKGKALRDHRGKLEPVKKNEELRIAHPHDLFARNDWDQWQHECFSAERVQPFKQVFRELYVVTKQEKKDGALSSRYAGQQINPSQAMALWGSRGWNTQDGVFKTFHDLGITAHVSFQYDVGTPGEVEGLTVEGVRFQQRDVREPLKLDKTPPRLFSEVMRDIDLVVSVAHRGGVDPEASASTVEMRTTLLSETCDLLGLKNVRVKGTHAFIKGRLAEYSVHLGSAGVHRLPGGALCIIPIHAQHRGRLFLPFADDDPRTAELISKVLLLARDDEIQDPSILEQLRA